MSDTIDDFKVDDDDWTDVYTVTGITSGTSISICNKGGYPLIIQESSTKPVATDNDGVLLATYRTGANNAIISTGSNGVWLKALSSGCKVNVQEV